jgi:enamine deaminase RidA (YjgF/YER057c/UK114 family)
VVSLRSNRRALLPLALACALALAASSAQRKNKKEEETQTLQLPKDLPTAISGETRHLAFVVTPLSPKGLLSQQVRDGLKALAHQAGSDRVLKIRAFVAGSGDLRRVRDLVSEAFTDRKQPLPVLSLIQSGGLPLEGAQLVMEATLSSHKDLNPNGLAFISAQTATSPNPLDPVPPLMAKALAALGQAVKAAGTESAGVLRVTCFLSSLDNVAASRQLVEAVYPTAAIDLVQTQRAPFSALAACEAVARLRSGPSSDIGASVRVLNPESLPSEPGQSQIALIAAPQVVLSGTQVSFGYQLADARLAFERLAKVLEQEGSSAHDVAFAHYYPLSSGIAAQVRAVRGDFFDPAHPPAGTLLLFEGLPSMDAGFAVDVVAVKK